MSAPYTAKCYDPGNVVAKYVSCMPVSGELIMVEVDSRSFTIKSYEVHAESLTPTQLAAAMERQYQAFGAVMVWARSPEHAIGLTE